MNCVHFIAAMMYELNKQWVNLEWQSLKNLLAEIQLVLADEFCYNSAKF